VVIAGSISAYPASSLLAARLPEYEIPRGKVLHRVYAEQVRIQLDAGIEALAVEMMNADSYATVAMEVALGSGLPVWLGISPVDRGGPDLQVVGRHRRAGPVRRPSIPPGRPRSGRGRFDALQK